MTTRTALAAQQLIDEGIPVHPGESVRYVIADAQARDKDKRVAESWREDGRMSSVATVLKYQSPVAGSSFPLTPSRAVKRVVVSPNFK